MRYFYIAVTTEIEKGKYYSYGIKVNSTDNLLCKIENRNFLHANICETKKKCDELVNCWNESYKRNGTYAFSKPMF